MVCAASLLVGLDCDHSQPSRQTVNRLLWSSYVRRFHTAQRNVRQCKGDVFVVVVFHDGESAVIVSVGMMMGV